MPYIPVSFSATASALREIALVEESVLDNILRHESLDPEQDLLAIEQMCKSGLAILHTAIQRPTWHEVPVHQLEQLLGQMVVMARAALSVITRYRESGRFGCNAIEREQLKDLVSALSAIRESIPRRVVLESEQLARRTLSLQLPPPQPGEPI